MKHKALSKLFLVVLLSAFATPLFAQTQAECEADIDAKLKAEVFPNMQQAGSLSYKKMYDQILNCVETGACLRLDAMVVLQEIMVDEQMIDTQRKKVALLKELVRKLKQAGEDACAAKALLAPSLFAMQTLNEKQIGRMKILLMRNFIY